MGAQELALADARALANWEAAMLRAPDLEDAEPEPDRAEEALQDPDSYADWLGAKVFGRSAVSVFPAAERTEQDLHGWSVWDLLTMARDPGQPAVTRCAAMDAIEARYLAHLDEVQA